MKKKKEEMTFKKALILPLLIIAIGVSICSIFWLISKTDKLNKEVFDRRYVEYIDEKETKRKDLESRFVEGAPAIYKITEKQIKTDRLITNGLPLGTFNAPFIKVWDKKSDKVYWGEVIKELYDRVAVGEELSVVIAEDESSIKLVDYDIVIPQTQLTEETS